MIQINQFRLFQILVFMLVVMQASVITEVFLGGAVRLIQLIASFLIILGCLLFTYLGNKRSNYNNILLLEGFVFFNLELIIIVGQPDLASMKPFIQRMVVYTLIMAGTIYGYLYQKIEGKSFSKIAVIFTVLTLLVLVIKYQNVVTQIAFETKGRITGSDDVSEVGISFSFGVLSLFCMGYAFSRASIYSLIFYLLASILLITPVVYSASRGALIAYFLVLALFIVKYLSSTQNKAANKAIFLFSLPVVCSVGALYVMSDDILYRQLEFLIQRFLGLGEINQDVSSAGRMDIINYYLSRMDLSIIYGFFGYSGLYPHNLALDFAIRFGIVGFLVSIVVYYMSFRVILNFDKLVSSDIEKVLFGVFLMSFINAQYSLTSEFLRFFWFSLFYFYFKHRAKKC